MESLSPRAMSTPRDVAAAKAEDAGRSGNRRIRKNRSDFMRCLSGTAGVQPTGNGERPRRNTIATPPASVGKKLSYIQDRPRWEISREKIYNNSRLTFALSAKSPACTVVQGGDTGGRRLLFCFGEIVRVPTKKYLRNLDLFPATPYRFRLSSRDKESSRHEDIFAHA